jgi:hypothetical protein
MAEPMEIFLGNFKEDYATLVPIPSKNHTYNNPTINRGKLAIY